MAELFNYVVGIEVKFIGQNAYLVKDEELAGKLFGF
jgi:hypothetical protein